MTQNRIEFRAVERIDRRGLTKDRRAARHAHHRDRAQQEVASLVEDLRDPEDRRMALEARLKAYAAAHSLAHGEASTVAILGSLAVQEGAGITVAKAQPDFAQLVAQAAAEVEL